MGDVISKRKSTYGCIVNENETQCMSIDNQGRSYVAQSSLDSIYFKRPLLNGSSKNLGVNGSSTVQNFSISPTVGKIWYLEGLSLVIADAGAFNPTSFGALAGLSNGLLINVKSKSVTNQLCNLQNNLDIYASFSESSLINTIDGGLLGSDQNIYRGNIFFKNRIPLLNTDNDNIQASVRDNLTGLSGLYLYALYYEVVHDL